MRIERIILEHHGDVALFGRHIVDDALADGDLAAGDAFEPGDHAQKRGLAAARRADQHDEFAIRDIDAHTMEDLGAAIGLARVTNLDFGHAWAILPFRTPGCYLMGVPCEPRNDTNAG